VSVTVTLLIVDVCMYVYVYDQIPYSSPISVSSYPYFAVTFMLLGLFFMAGYFVNQMKAGSKSLFMELVLAVLSSGLLGFGTFFLMLSFDLYV